MKLESDSNQPPPPVGRTDRTITWKAAFRFALFAAALNFALNFVWEISQGSLYAAPHAARLPLNMPLYCVICLRASLGDVAITVISYLIAAGIARDIAWLIRSPKLRFFAPLAAWLTSGLLITVWLEHEALATGRWAYGRLMPTIGGVGLAPLLQWVVVPLIWFWLLRKKHMRLCRHFRQGRRGKRPGSV